MCQFFSLHLWSLSAPEWQEWLSVLMTHAAQWLIQKDGIIHELNISGYNRCKCTDSWIKSQIHMDVICKRFKPIIHILSNHLFDSEFSRHLKGIFVIFVIIFLFLSDHWVGKKKLYESFFSPTQSWGNIFLVCLARSIVCAVNPDRIK